MLCFTMLYIRPHITLEFGKRTLRFDREFVFWPRVLFSKKHIFKLVFNFWWYVNLMKHIESKIVRSSILIERIESLYQIFLQRMMLSKIEWYSVQYPL